MELVPIFQYKPVPITYWWIWMPLQEVNISIGTQIRSGSTMINTHWHAIIDAKHLFYFMILPVGRILIDPTVSIKGTLQRCPQNFLYLSSTKNALPRTMKVPVIQRWCPLVKISKCLDEETPAEGQSNGPYLTSGGTHYNFVLCSKSCIRGTEHNVIRVLCGDIDCRLPARVQN